MTLGKLQEMSFRFLVKLYELSEGGINPEVHHDLVKSSLGYSSAEARSVTQYLLSKDLVTFKCKVPCIKITPRGVDEAERIMQNQKGQTLEKLYKLADGRIQSISVSDLADSLGLTFDETYDDLRYWEDRGLVELSKNVDIEYESVKFTRPGLNAIEQPNNPNTPQGRYQNITYNMTIHGDQHGNIDMGGRGNTQTNIVVSSDFDQAIKRLLAGIEQSQSITPLQKIRVRGDVQTINDLARVEKTPEIVEEANTRIAGIQAVLSTTADLVSLGMVVIPILRATFGG